MRNRNTVEFIGIWEQLNNSDFKVLEFEDFKKQAGLNSFTLTPKQWIELADIIKFDTVIPLAFRISAKSPFAPEKEIRLAVNTGINRCSCLFCLNTFPVLRELGHRPLVQWLKLTHQEITNIFDPKVAQLKKI